MHPSSLYEVPIHVDGSDLPTDDCCVVDRLGRLLRHGQGRISIRLTTRISIDSLDAQLRTAGGVVIDSISVVVACDLRYSASPPGIRTTKRCTNIDGAVMVSQQFDPGPNRRSP